MAVLTGERSKAKLNAPQVETPPAINTGFGAAGDGGDQTLLAVFTKAGSSKVADDERSSRSWLEFLLVCACS